MLEGISGNFAKDILTDVLPFVIGIFTGFLFSVAIRICISPLIFRFPRIAPMKFYICYLAMFVALLSVELLWAEHIGTMILMPILPVIAICGIYIALYWGIRAYGRYQDHGSIWKERESEEEGREQSPKFMLEFGNTLVKRFYRINSRRARRGKAAWTSEEYMEHLICKDERDAAVWRVMAALYTVIIAVPVALSLYYEGVLDAMILGGVLVAIEVPIYSLCRKASRLGVRCRKKIMQECSARGMDLLEYVANLREQMQKNQKTY